jgi:hypothetical protein
VDLFGDHSVQVVTTTLLEAALVLTLAVLVVLLSVRVAQQSAIRPAVAPAVLVRSHCITPRGREAGISPVRRLRDSLPPRAPPPTDPLQRFRPTPPGAASARA